MLEVINLKKKFGDNEVLKGVNFSLEKGEVLSIIGSSGSGKTTLLRCLNGLETADEGQIVLNSEVLNTGKKGKNKLKLGLVFQNFNLFPHYNIINNITLAAYLQEKNRIKKVNSKLKKEGKKLSERKKIITDMKKSIKKDTIANGYELLTRVGLSDKAKAYPCELSGGQQQRVAIARALALKPEILCFDEPTSALDPELTGEVLKVIKELKDGDKTMIVVTHEMDFARSVSDKIIFMADGIIEEVGTPNDIFENPKSLKTKMFIEKSNMI